MTTTAQAALDRLEVDEAFAQRMRDAGGADASFALLRAEGFEVSREEMRDAMLDRYSDQLTPEQLDALAGGATDDLDDVVGVVLLTAGGVLFSVVLGAASV